MRIIHISNQYSSLYTVGLLLTLTITSGFILSSSHSSATGTASSSTSLSASITVPDSCSMHGTIASGEEHTATIQNGRYEEGIGITTIKIFCNDPSGYAVYAIGYTNDDLGNNHLTSNSLPSSNDIVSTATHLDGTALDWGMKLTPTGTNYVPTVLSPFSSYSAIPTNYTKVVEYGSNTDVRDPDDPNAIGSSFTTTYAVSISPTQYAGSYTGKVKYVLVHPSNSDSPAITTMQNVDLWGSSLLVGEEAIATDDRDNKTYTVARLCTNWNGNDCSESQIWMTQNLGLTIGASGAPTLTSKNTDLNDYKDNLGNNLDGYEYDSANKMIVWSPKETVTNPATISNFAYSGSTTTVVSGWTNSQTEPYQAEGKVGSSDDVYIVTSGTTGYDDIYTSLSACKSVQTSLPADADKTAFCQHYKVGNYYNWTAAIASNDSSSYFIQYRQAPNSICPAGWRLPQGLGGDTPNPAGTADADAVDATTMSEMNKLFLANGVTNGSTVKGYITGGGVNIGFTELGFNNIRLESTYRDTRLPLYFVRSGHVNDTTLYNSSFYGVYWSSTAVTSFYIYTMNFSSGNLFPVYRFGRVNGGSIRCLAR